MSYEIIVLVGCSCLAGTIGASIAAPLHLDPNWTIPIGFALGLAFGLIGLRYERKKETP